MKQAEEYYYGRMPKDKQNVYRAMLHGLMELSDEFLIPQVPTTDGNWLYDVFFQLRLDHQEIFWAVGFKYRYYKDSHPGIYLRQEQDPGASESSGRPRRQACTPCHEAFRVG